MKIFKLLSQFTSIILYILLLSMLFNQQSHAIIVTLDLPYTIQSKITLDLDKGLSEIKQSAHDYNLHVGTRLGNRWTCYATGGTLENIYLYIDKSEYKKLEKEVSNASNAVDSAQTAFNNADAGQKDNMSEKLKNAKTRLRQVTATLETLDNAAVYKGQQNWSAQTLGGTITYEPPVRFLDNILGLKLHGSLVAANCFYTYTHNNVAMNKKQLISSYTTEQKKQVNQIFDTIALKWRFGININMLLYGDIVSFDFGLSYCDFKFLNATTMPKIPSQILFNCKFNINLELF